jgi:hypothetical protein
MRGRRLLYAAIGTALLVVLMRTYPAPKPLFGLRAPEPASELAADFDAARCGQLRGKVIWSGPHPEVKPIELIRVANLPDGQTRVPNPNAPRIQNERLVDVFVYLEKVDLRQAHAWTLAPVVVEARTSGLKVKQGTASGRMGIVRRGQSVDLVSAEQVQPFHSIRGRGADFFTQMLPIPNRPVSRVMPDAGIVELTSASGYYWLRGHLLVSDHPYAALTTTENDTVFAQVPHGDYDLVCWAPNWHIEKVESDPEWAAPVRMHFRPGVTKRQRVHVKAGEVVDWTTSFTAADFEPAK